MTPAQRRWHLRIWSLLGPALLLGAGLLWAMGNPDARHTTSEPIAEVGP